MAKVTFGTVGVSRQSFNLEVDARDYGFEPTETPRTDRSVKKTFFCWGTLLQNERKKEKTFSHTFVELT